MTTTASRNKILEFKKWVLDIGDGTVPAIAKDGEIEETWIKIPDEFLIEPEQDPIEKIVTSTYPLFEEMQGNTEYLKERAILTPKNETVNEINQYMLQFVPGEKNHYLSSDSICKASSNIPDQDNLYPVEFLNALEFPGIPNHKIELKEGVPIMLLRNVNQKLGMCNGTRLIVIHLGKIITGSNIGTKVLIPRIVLSPTESKWPFILKRRQFPLKICYAMTINKSQGQTLNNMGLYLPSLVFSHGQLYVALSRVTRLEGLKILIKNKDKQEQGYTKNIVYKEVFNNLPKIQILIRTKLVCYKIIIFFLVVIILYLIVIMPIHFITFYYYYNS